MLTDTGAPLIHRGHPLARLVHDGAPSGFVEQLELAVGDETVYFNDGVRVRVKARHLAGDVSHFVCLQSNGVE